MDDNDGSLFDDVKGRIDCKNEDEGDDELCSEVEVESS